MSRMHYGRRAFLAALGVNGAAAATGSVQNLLAGKASAVIPGPTDQGGARYRITNRATGLVTKEEPPMEDREHIRPPSPCS